MCKDVKILKVIIIVYELGFFICFFKYFYFDYEFVMLIICNWKCLCCEEMIWWKGRKKKNIWKRKNEIWEERKKKDMVWLNMM